VIVLATWRSRRIVRQLAVLAALIAVVSVFVLPGAAAAAPTAAALDTSGYAARVVQLTNAERAKVGLRALNNNTSLAAAAQSYARVLSSDACFAHTCQPVPDLAQRLANAGYTFTGFRSWSWGENIAAGYSTPEAVVAGWMASSGHRANILNSGYHDLGVGFVQKAGSRYGTYWVQDFGARNR
jgi:uncharacterized protein YkwD